MHVQPVKKPTTGAQTVAHALEPSFDTCSPHIGANFGPCLHSTSVFYTAYFTQFDVCGRRSSKLDCGKLGSELLDYVAGQMGAYARTESCVRLCTGMYTQGAL